MTNINTFYAKALTSVVVPPGTVFGGFVATDRFSYGFQVFKVDDGEGAVEEVIVLNDGVTAAVTSAQWHRHQMFAELADTIYGKQTEAVPEPAPLEIDDPAGATECVDFDQFDLDDTALVAEESPEVIAEPVKVPEKNTLVFGPIPEQGVSAYFKECGDVWALTGQIAGAVTAFLYADNHVVVAKDGGEFWEKHSEDTSFRTPSPHEQIVGYRTYPFSVVFNDFVVDGDKVTPPMLSPLDSVIIHFVAGGKVTKRAFEVDWTRVGDPYNDVVAYQIVIGR